MDLGWRFWVKWAILLVALGIAAMIVFLLIGVAWAAWGLFGTLAALAVVLLLFGWLYDRREAKRRAEYDQT
jgi:hypothetical protein